MIVLRALPQVEGFDARPGKGEGVERLARARRDGRLDLGVGDAQRRG